MVQRMWAEAAGPAGGAEPLFPGSRRSRSVWDAVRLEVGGPDSCPVVLHSFTQLDPDLPRLEVGEPGGPRAPPSEEWVGAQASLAGHPPPVVVVPIPWSRGLRGRVFLQKSPFLHQTQGSQVDGCGGCRTAGPTV